MEEESISALEVLFFLYITPFRRSKVNIQTAYTNSVPLLLLKRESILSSKETLQIFIDFLNKNDEYDKDVYAFNQSLANYLEEGELQTALQPLIENEGKLLQQKELQSLSSVEVVFRAYSTARDNKDENMIRALQELIVAIDPREVVSCKEIALITFVKNILQQRSSDTPFIKSCNHKLATYLYELQKDFASNQSKGN